MKNLFTTALIIFTNNALCMRLSAPSCPPWGCIGYAQASAVRAQTSADSAAELSYTLVERAQTSADSAEWPYGYVPLVRERII